MLPHREASRRSRPQNGGRRRALRVACLWVAPLAVMMLSGCAWFSPDAGMGVVANVADRELDKDVAAIRTPDQARRWPSRSGVSLAAR